MADDDTTSVSTESFLTSLIYNSAVFGVLFLGFIFLRYRVRRIYSPRSYMETIPQPNRTESLPSGIFAWIKSLVTKPDAYVLRQTGLDGYFFLRYLKFIIFVTFFGVVVTYPILLPLNATSNGQQHGLDILTFSNVSQKNRLFAHVFLAWIYYGFVLFSIYREFIYFVSVRQAVLTSPYYWNSISSRTVLIQTIPDSYLTERNLSEMFNRVRRVWVNRNYKELEAKCAERTKLVMQLESAEVKLIKTGVKNKLKADKKAAKAANKSGADIEKAAEKVAGASTSDISEYVPDKKRPTKRLKPLIGKKVQTIDYNRTRIAELNEEIATMQEDHQTNKSVNSAFIEFETVEDAQDAYQLLSYHMPLHMAPRYIGIRPDEVIWPNLRMTWWERLLRSTGATAFICALVVFWAIPVAFVGIISNVPYLIKKVPFLKFLLQLKKVKLYGLVTSLLPTIMLAVLMALLPPILRLMAKVSGVPSRSLVELRVQNYYFAFQVVQVFLVTTITSSATSVVTQIIENPTSAMSLLSTNLPKSSNFYIDYLLLQALSGAGGMFMQTVALALYYVLSYLLDGTPRKKFKRWSSLGSMGWGTVYPVYTNLFVITLTYSIISPLIIIFTFVGFILIYLACLYSLMYVKVPDIDTTGLTYPRALYQTFTGMYLGQVCLLGLFAVSKNWACIVLVAICLGFTAFFQVTLQKAFDPLLGPLPRSIELEHERWMAARNVAPVETGDSKEATALRNSHTSDDQATVAVYESNLLKARFANPIWRFLRPDIFASYVEMREKMVPDWVYPTPTALEEELAFVNPAVLDKAPTIWIPRDSNGWSTKEIADTSSITPITDAGAGFNEKGKIVREGILPDYEEPSRL
ncbi:uncharacterized protein V1510DRAFT_359607 [Dipodascopsis tothii]|uniref:uncharacterized protein n=1 Tax=Dipodascopsis tothii TaxID=44089 RepID=UPI0034CF4FC7